MSQHAVIIHFVYGTTDMTPLLRLEDQLWFAVDKAMAGEYDFHEVALDGLDGSLYMYGPDADRLFALVEPILRRTEFIKGAQVLKRYGDVRDDPKETVITI